MSKIESGQRQPQKLLAETYGGLLVLAVSGALLVLGFLMDASVL
jgi:hypothetical protein